MTTPAQPSEYEQAVRESDLGQVAWLRNWYTIPTILFSVVDILMILLKGWT